MADSAAPSRDPFTEEAIVVLAVAELIAARRERGRFIGRRSADKTRGEIVEVADPDCVPAEGYPVVEYTRGRNFDAEAEAEDRAGQLSDEWTAREIIEFLKRSRPSE